MQHHAQTTLHPVSPPPCTAQTQCLTPFPPKPSNQLPNPHPSEYACPPVSTTAPLPPKYCAPAPCPATHLPPPAAARACAAGPPPPAWCASRSAGRPPRPPWRAGGWAPRVAGSGWRRTPRRSERSAARDITVGYAAISGRHVHALQRRSWHLHHACSSLGSFQSQAACWAPAAPSRSWFWRALPRRTPRTLPCPPARLGDGRAVSNGRFRIRFPEGEDGTCMPCRGSSCQWADRMSHRHASSGSCP